VIARCRAAELHLLQGGIETDTADQLHDRGVRFHESLVEGSGNPFFIDTMRRVNRVRRLLSYRSMRDRSRRAPRPCIARTSGALRRVFPMNRPRRRWHKPC
jgi:DNA-binding GntR family transcriptional regulator